MRAFCFLTSGVHADGRTTEDGSGVNDNVAVVNGNRKAIHAAWCGAALLFADTVEL
jgi:hypothetical protein